MSTSIQCAPEIVTERLLLRGHRVEDFDAMVALWQHETTYRYISGRPSTPAETWSRMLRYVGHWQLLGFGNWAVEDRQTGAYIGVLGFSGFPLNADTPRGNPPEAGWVLDPNVHGRGMASEGLSAAHAWFDAQDIGDRIACRFDPDHVISRRVAEKQGYGFVEMTQDIYGPTALMERVKPARA